MGDLNLSLSWGLTMCGYVWEMHGTALEGYVKGALGSYPGEELMVKKGEARGA